MRVLFVDDEANFLTPLIKRLNKRGVAAQGVGCGEEALSILKIEDFDVVVLDLKMPGMCGHTTLRKIRTLHPQLPVIMLTGHADLEDTVHSLEQGAFDHLMKPVSLDELIYRLEDAHKAARLGFQTGPPETHSAKTFDEDEIKSD